MATTIPFNLSNPNKHKLLLQKQKARDSWQKIALKIISWKANTFKFTGSSKPDKITKSEWLTYCKEFLKINESLSEKQAKDKLKTVKTQIDSVGGFE